MGSIAPLSEFFFFLKKKLKKNQLRGQFLSSTELQKLPLSRLVKTAAGRPHFASASDELRTTVIAGTLL